MGKVLVHRGFSTLDIIAVGLLVVSIFEVVLTAVRSYVFAHTLKGGGGNDCLLHGPDGCLWRR